MHPKCLFDYTWSHSLWPDIFRTFGHFPTFSGFAFYVPFFYSQTKLRPESLQTWYGDIAGTRTMSPRRWTMVQHWTACSASRRALNVESRYRLESLTVSDRPDTVPLTCNSDDIQPCQENVSEINSQYSFFACTFSWMACVIFSRTLLLLKMYWLK